MLMKLAVWGCVSKARMQAFWVLLPNACPADAHDACFLGGFVSKVRPANVHDSGCLGFFLTNVAQLMLMIPAVYCFLTNVAQLMLMMPAVCGLCV